MATAPTRPHDTSSAHGEKRFSAGLFSAAHRLEKVHAAAAAAAELNAAAGPNTPNTP